MDPPPEMVPANPSPALAQVSIERIAGALVGSGLWFDLGALIVRVQSDSPDLPHQLQAAYGHYPIVEDADWADVHCRVDRATGLRRWIRPQVNFWSDARTVFAPFPADSPLPMFEWGCNWLIGQRTHQLLLLHAATLERDGLALLMPALPGSGKSTLAAALSQRGWRLLSDEFGACDPECGLIVPVLKPVALKNESIEVLRAFAPEGRFGPVFPNTRKGRVVHLAPQASAVALRKSKPRPGAVVLPRWEAGRATSWKRLSQDTAFSALAFNAFNYRAGRERFQRRTCHRPLVPGLGTRIQRSR